MSRALTLKNLYDKTFQTYELEGVYKDVFGNPSRSGLWLVYGKEKNGKTWATLLLMAMLIKFQKGLYVSAEEGADMEFQASCKRAKIDKDANMLIIEYEPIEDLYKRLRSRKAPRLVVLDNLTIYNDELKASGVKKLLQDFPDTHFICVAHEERNKPYTAAATMASKLAKVIIRVEGLQMTIGGRVPGGTLNIDEKKAQLYHGTKK